MRSLSRTVKIVLAAAIAVVICITGGGIFSLYVAVSYVQGLELASEGYREVAMQHYTRAISQFDAALGKYLDSYHRSYVYLNRASACNHEHRLAESLHDNTEALRLNPQLTLAYEGRAWAYQQNGDTDKALGDLNEALRQRSSSEYAYYARGMILYNRKDYEHALADFQEAVRCSPASVEPVVMRARCYLAKKDLDGALANLDAAIMLDPENAHTYEERAHVYQLKREPDKSARDTAWAAQLGKNIAHEKQVPPLGTSDKAYFLMLQAHAAYDAHDFDRAIAIENEAIASNPTAEWTSVFVMDRGSAYSAKGDLNRATSDYNEAITLNPKNAGAHVNRGRLLGQSRHYAEAQKDYEEAIRLNPAQWEAYYDRAADLRASGKTAEALVDLNKVTELNSTFIPAYLKRADIYTLTHEPQKAMQELEKATSINPMTAGIYRARATVHIHDKDFKAALHDFETAAGLETAHPEVSLNSLAWFCATCSDQRGRDGEKALTAARKACELTKWLVWEDIDTLAAAHAEAGQFGQAVKYQDQAIRMAPRGSKSIPDMRKRLALYQRHKPYREQPDA